MLKRTHPMAGLYVLEVGRAVSVSILGKLMVDLGATVLQFAPALRKGEPQHLEAAFALWDKGKSVVENVEEASQALGRCDVVIRAVWWKGARELGLALPYEEIVTNNPAVICCSIDTGLGTLPDWLTVGDLEGLLMARAGMFRASARQPEEDKESVSFVEMPMASIGTAIQALIACSAALNSRAGTGLGANIQLCLARTPLYSKGVFFLETAYGVGLPGTASNGRTGQYRGSDGRWFLMAAGSERIARRLPGLLEKAGVRVPDLPAFQRPTHEVTDDDAASTRRALEVAFSNHPAEFWERHLQSGGVPCSMSRRPSEWLEAEQPRRSGGLETSTLPEFGSITGIGRVVTVRSVDRSV